MIRKKMLYKRPMKLYQKNRIQEENVLLKKYGLKNKREIWKTLAKIDYYRKRAMSLANAQREDQESFFNYLRGIGLSINSISDILGLGIEDLLRRRLSNIIVERKLANTQKQARQMIVHKKIIVGENVVNAPSYIVPLVLEQNIKIKRKNKAENENIKSENQSVEGEK